MDFDPFRSPYILPPEMHEQDSRDQPFLKDELSPAANSSFEEAVPAYEVRLLKDALEKRVFTSAVRLAGSGLPDDFQGRDIRTPVTGLWPPVAFSSRNRRADLAVAGPFAVIHPRKGEPPTNCGRPKKAPGLTSRNPRRVSRSARYKTILTAPTFSI